VLRHAAADQRAGERPGADRVDEDAVTGELERRVAHHVDHRRLAGGVAVADERLGTEAGVRGGDDDPAGALALHHGRGGAHRVHHAVQVHVEHPVPVLAPDGVDRLAALDAEAGHRGEARVGERDVDAALAVDGVVEERLHLRIVPDVGDERVRVVASLDEIARRRLEPCLVDVGERHVRAAVRQYLGHREAEAARRAGDHDPGAPDVEEASERLCGTVRHGESTRTTAFITSAGFAIA
jgi:hypothetical protein